MRFPVRLINMGQWNKYIEVNCVDCETKMFKRDDFVKHKWSGRCKSCSMKEVANRHELKKQRSIRAREQVLKQGGIPNAHHFDSSDSGKNHWHWKGGKPKCLGCGKLLAAYSSFRCKSCETKGNRHWNWQNGKSKESYTQDWTKVLKESIRMRDNYKCQSCGVPQLECNQSLDIHHIDYDKHNCNPTNLISLCKSCHMKTHCGTK